MTCLCCGTPLPDGAVVSLVMTPSGPKPVCASCLPYACEAEEGCDGRPTRLCESCGKDFCVDHLRPSEHDCEGIPG